MASEKRISDYNIYRCRKALFDLIKFGDEDEELFYKLLLTYPYSYDESELNLETIECKICGRDTYVGNMAVRGGLFPGNCQECQDRVHARQSLNARIRFTLKNIDGHEYNEEEVLKIVNQVITEDMISLNVVIKHLQDKVYKIIKEKV